MSTTSTTRRDLAANPSSEPPREPASAASPPRRIGRGSLRAALPTATILAVLVGLAAWGHSTGWTLPKFSSLMGTTDPATLCAEGADGWCKEHNVSEAECIECNSKLLAPLTDYGFCSLHGVAQCPFEHPDVAQLKEIPTVTTDEVDRANRALALAPRTENNSLCKHYQRRIQFASQAAVEKAGVDIAVVDQKRMVEAITANGEVMYDETHTAHLASRVAGTVWRVEKQVGQPVNKGDILALVESADVGRAKSEFLQAIAALRLAQTNVDRLTPLTAGGAVPGKQLREAEANLQAADIKLLGAQQTLVNLGMPVNAEDFAGQSTQQIAKQIQFLGLPDSVVAGFDANSTTSNLLPLRSPLDGIVVDCKIVSGETVDSSRLVFTVTDLRNMWLVLDVRQEEAGYLSLGQPVLFRPADSRADSDTHGTIAWISTAADERTRTVKLRVDLPNTDGRLRANTFGTGRIVLRDEPKAIVVPSEAVHSDGDCQIVFVRDKEYFREGAPKFFHVREVRLGVHDGDTTEIIAGLLPGEVVACKNSVVLEAQLLKSNLGEGCACCAAAKK